MIAVAVVGFWIAFARLWRLSNHYAEQARSHGFLTKVYRKQVSVPLLDPFHIPAARRQGLISRAEALAVKYRRAARYPWLPVEPDPPEPE
jgi:hypothetical protein